MDRPFLEKPWFFERCREVQASPDGHIDLWFREGGKSTIITIGKTIQDIFNDPEITVGIFSHTRAIAKSFLRVIKREFENNNRLREWFPDILWADPHKEAPKWSEDDGIIVRRRGNPPESTIEAAGLVDGMPTGRHFALRVYDDVVTLASVATPEQMQKTTEAMDMSNNLGQVGGAVRMIGTRYKMGDTYEEYIKRGKMRPRIYPATDDGTAEGNPVYFTQKEWEDKLLDMSPAIIASQMLQNPLASETVIFQEDWFNIWPAYVTHKDDNGTEQYVMEDGLKPKLNALPELDAVYMSLDGAVSQNETADFSCLLTLGLFKATEGSEKYSVILLDCLMERLAYPDLRDKVIEQWGNKFGPTEKEVDGIIIEDKSSGSSLLQDLPKARVSVYPYRPKRMDKIARANLVSPLVRDGYVWLPESRNPKRKGHPMNWLNQWWQQIRYFPNVKNDDGVDAFTQALIKLDKMGWIRGREAPERQKKYYQRPHSASYSGDAVHREY